MRSIYSYIILFFLFTFSLTKGFSQQKDEDDADLPKFKTNISKQEYLNARESYINFKRGITTSLPYNARLRALIRMRSSQLQTGRKTATNTSSANWVELGPSPIPNGQTDSASVPVSGRVTVIEVHPTNSNIVYVGTSNGGVYRSMDGGNSWTAIFDGAQSLAIGALALAPSNPSILFVGTGEPNLSQDSYAGVGLYRIDNADASPTLVGPIDPPYTFNTGNNNTSQTGTFTFRSISKILVDPSNPANIFVSTSTGVAGNPGISPSNFVPPTAFLGIYRSMNATASVNNITFQKLTVNTFGTIESPSTGNRRITDMVMEPGNPNKIICWVLGDTTKGDGGIFRSVNAMAASPTFTQVFQETTKGGSRANLSIMKEGSDVIVYAATGESSTGTACPNSSGVVRKSRDGGATWSTKLNGGGGFCGGQCFFDIAIAVSPNDSNKIMLGGAAASGCAKIMQMSTNAGNAFATHEALLHADTHTVTFSASNPNIIYTGNDGGIFKSTNGGITWNSMNTTGFKATQFQSLALHPIDPNFTVGGTQDNGTNLLNSTASFSRIDFGDGGSSAIDQNAINVINTTLYHTYFTQSKNLIAYVFSDSGQLTNENTWNAIGCFAEVDTPISHNGIGCSDNVLFYAPMTLGPGKPNVVYFGTDRLYRNSTHGTTDTNIVVSQAPISGSNVVTSIAISKKNDNLRLLGMNNGSVWYTTTGSSTLKNATPLVTNPLKEVGKVAYDTAKNIAYVTYGGYDIADSEHVWKCSNLSSGTPVWTKAGGGIPDVPVNAFAIDPKNSNILYAGTDIGVFQSIDGGASWISYNTGLPSVPVFDMAIHPVTRVLRIATHGRGLWQTTTQSPLPVTFISLTATAKKFGKVFLEWFTSSEFNNKGFELQRAINTGGSANVVFQDVSFIEGAGNSNITMRYNYDDYPTGGNKFLYRIKQIDNDGNFKYSDVKAVEFNDFDYALFQNTPNPSGASTLIKYQLPIKGHVSILLYNAAGAMVKSIVNEEKEAGIYEVKVNTASLSNGNYYYKYVVNDFRLSKQMSVTK